ncbi:MAG: hypothetical protein HOD92_04695 [Deltaproteobacteria bacterium]|jgi:hypothetical protein|nr:hypothetical protein [Deltaproteobacteria bacterium]MBT4525988.1 hypothetical protein [Deltaproteobacteria bacterium]
MPATIYVRERRKVDKGEKKARFRVVGVSGGDLKLYAKHIRKTELNMIAQETGAKVVYFEQHGTGKKDGSGK